MKKLELAKEELERLNVFQEYKNIHMKKMVAILGKDVPELMAITIANYVLASFVGHFHYKMKIEEGNVVPINIIAFVLAKSGAKKTSSITKLEHSLQKGFDAINAWRQLKEEQRAIKLDISPRRLNPLSNALATEAGMIKRLNDFKKEGLGLPTMFVDEISTELATNPDIIPNIKLISQLFDAGDCKSKPLKDSENQSEEVIGMGMNGLFIGSEYGILNDETVLVKFLTEFISKFSRRCFFVCPDFPRIETTAQTIDDVLKEISDERDEIKIIKDEMNSHSQKIALKAIKRDYNILDIPEDTRRLYDIYKIYCEERATLFIEEHIHLEIQHRHWKALKLAGVYAAFREGKEINEQDLKEAIWVAESGEGHLQKFMDKAEQKPFEKILNHYIEGFKPLSVHELVKKKWIKKVIEVDDLLRLANSKLGNEGLLRVEKDMIVLEKFIQTEGVGCSYKICTGTKQERRYKVADGFKYNRADFWDLQKIVSNDTAYSPFEFIDGVRGKDNVIGSCDYIVFDIDKTEDTDVECSDILADFKHIICRTSDKENPYKYRILIPTDISVNVSNEKWMIFMKALNDYIGIDADVLPKSQIYYGYKGTTPIINEEGTELEVSDIIKTLAEPIEELKELPPEKLQDIYKNRLQQFEWFYEAGNPSDKTAKGHYHNTLWLASKNMHDIGVDYQTAVAIITDIIEFRERKPRPNYFNWLTRTMKTYPKWVGQKSILDEEEEEYKY